MFADIAILRRGHLSSAPYALRRPHMSRWLIRPLANPNFIYSAVRCMRVVTAE